MADTRGDMVERVARAIWADRHPETPAWPFEIDRQNYRGHARAAIEAMREPTEAQMRVFRQHFGFNPFVKDGGPADHLFATAYKAAIDAILKEGD